MFYKKPTHQKTFDRDQVVMLAMDQLVPEDHKLRKIDHAIDFSFIYDLVEPLYSQDAGRNSIDPVILFKLVFLNFLEGNNSIRKTCEEAKVNVAYRWFLGVGFFDSIPDHSTFSQNYKRKFKNTKIFEEIFSNILHQAMKQNLLDLSVLFIDGTHIKANANKQKVVNREVKKTVSKYRVMMNIETGEVRESMGRDSFDDQDPTINSSEEVELESFETEETKVQKVSLTDPECGIFNKGEHEIQCAYVAQVACDQHGWIVACEVNPGNVHDSNAFLPFYYNHIKDYQPKTIVADAAYGNGINAYHMMGRNIDFIVPYRRPVGRDGKVYSKKKFKYQMEIDAYQCPAGELLRKNNIDKNGMLEYVSETHICKNCEQKQSCIGRYARKTIRRGLYEECYEYVCQLRKRKESKEIYSKRKETIERSFGEAKEKFGLRYTRYRGLSKNQDLISLLFACMNMKKLATLLYKREKQQPSFS